MTNAATSTSDNHDPEDLVRATLTAEDTIDMAEKTGIAPVEYAQTKYGVDATKYASERSLHAAHTSLREALYPERQADLAETEPSEAARGAAMLTKMVGDTGKSIEQAHQEVNGTTGGMDTDTALAAASPEIDERAQGALEIKDHLTLNHTDLSPAQYVYEVYGIDPRDHDEDSLRGELSARRDEFAVTRHRHSLRRQKRNKEKAKLRERVAADIEERYADPSADVDQFAFDALAGTERGRRMSESERSNADYLRDEFGVDPREYEHEVALREALRASIDTESE